MSLDGQTMIIEERQLLEVEGFFPETIGKENVLRIFDFSILVSLGEFPTWFCKFGSYGAI